MTTQWQYLDSSNKIVFRTNDDGGTESQLASNDEIVAWIAAGNTPLSPAGPTLMQQKLTIIQQLSDLDSFLPRALEDFWIATSFDTTLLPSIQQTRLSQKQSLRSQLTALGS